MPFLLNVASVLMCPHGGIATGIPSHPNVLIAGAPVLLATDPCIIAGCAFMIGPVPSPCLTVQWVVPAMITQVSGIPALTQASVGLCIAATMAPQGPVIVAYTQTMVMGT